LKIGSLLFNNLKKVGKTLFNLLDLGAIIVAADLKLLKRHFVLPIFLIDDEYRLDNIRRLAF